MTNTSATSVKKRTRVSRSIKVRRGVCPTLKEKVDADLLSFVESEARLQGENYEHRQE
jgi:hypothetical protein